jgi:hypothetical protein
MRSIYGVNPRRDSRVRRGLHQRQGLIAGIRDRGRRDWLGPPSLRTVQAGLPHTALQSVVLPLRGLARQLMGRFQAMQPLFGKEGIGPAIVI